MQWEPFGIRGVTMSAGAKLLLLLGDDAVPWTPAALPTVVKWHRHDQLVTTELDTGRNRVTQWGNLLTGDASYFSNYVSGGVERPYYEHDIGGVGPVVGAGIGTVTDSLRFVAMKTSTRATDLTSMYRMLYFRTPAAWPTFSGAPQIASHVASTSVIMGWLYYYQHAANTYYLTIRNTTPVYVAGPYTEAQWINRTFLVEVWHTADGTAGWVNVDGVRTWTYSTAGPGAFSLLAGQELRLMRNSNAFVGAGLWVGEEIVAAQAPSVADRAALIRYINAYWGQSYPETV